MKISIITPSLNQADYLETNLKSVLSQQGNFDLELNIVDGGSDDGTIEILKKFDSRIRWISEEDNGQADAINKGVQICTGEIIGWLNSDDLYLENTLQTVVSYFEKNAECNWLFGKCNIIDDKGTEIRSFITKYKNYRLSRYSYKKLLVENFISQPAVFFRKSLFEEVGGLNTDYNFAMDYDLWLRFGKQFKPHLIDKNLSAFRKHASTKSENYYVRQFKEEYKIACKYTQSRFIKFRHWLNIWKIIFAYKLIK